MEKEKKGQEKEKEEEKEKAKEKSEGRGKGKAGGKEGWIYVFRSGCGEVRKNIKNSCYRKKRDFS